MKRHIDDAFEAYLELPDELSEEEATGILIAAAIFKASEQITEQIEFAARVIREEGEK